MNMCKSIILPHGDTDGRFQATKMNFFSSVLPTMRRAEVHCLCMPNSNKTIDRFLLVHDLFEYKKVSVWSPAECSLWKTCKTR